MQKRILGLMLGTMMIASSMDAAATPFAEKGAFVIGGEQLAGFGVSKLEFAEGDVSSTYVSLLGNNSGLTPFDMPRLAFDFFVIDRLSIGGTVTYARETLEVTTGSVSMEQPSVSTFVFSPRVGFGTRITDRLGFWVRGGITYFRGDQEIGNTDTDWSGINLNIDPAVLVFLSDAVALGVGPTLNVPLDGSIEAGSSSTDAKMSMYGVAVSVHGVL